MTVESLRQRLHQLIDISGDRGAFDQFLEALARFDALTLEAFAVVLNKVKLTAPRPPRVSKRKSPEEVQAEKDRKDREKQEKAETTRKKKEEAERVKAQKAEAAERAKQDRLEATRKKKEEAERTKARKAADLAAKAENAAAAARAKQDKLDATRKKKEEAERIKAQKAEAAAAAKLAKAAKQAEADVQNEAQVKSIAESLERFMAGARQNPPSQTDIDRQLAPLKQLGKPQLVTLARLLRCEAGLAASASKAKVIERISVMVNRAVATASRVTL